MGYRSIRILSVYYCYYYCVLTPEVLGSASTLIPPLSLKLVIIVLTRPAALRLKADNLKAQASILYFDTIL